jgi:hypothetical protein
MDFQPVLLLSYHYWMTLTSLTTLEVLLLYIAGNSHGFVESLVLELEELEPFARYTPLLRNSNWI